MPDWAVELGNEVARSFPDFLDFLRLASPEEVRQVQMDLGIALSTFIPGVGDLIGLGADVKDMWDNADQRTPTNVGLTIASLIPGVPSEFSVLK